MGKKIATAQQMIRDADPQDRSTLLEELPSYFAAENLPTGWIDDVAAQAAPEMAQTQQRLTNAQQARVMARQNAELLRKGIQKRLRTNLSHRSISVRSESLDVCAGRA